MQAAPCIELDLAPSACAPYPPSTVLVCAPDVISGQWRVGQARVVDDTGWGPVVCTPLGLVASGSTLLDLGVVPVTALDLDPIVCVEA